MKAEKSFDDIGKEEFCGLVRHVDKQSRLCVPKEFRASLALAEEDALRYTLFTDGVLIQSAQQINPEFYDTRHRIDRLGRVCIPADMRRALGINKFDEVEVFLLRSSLFVRKKQ